MTLQVWLAKQGVEQEGKEQASYIIHQYSSSLNDIIIHHDQWLRINLMTIRITYDYQNYIWPMIIKKSIDN